MAQSQQVSFASRDTFEFFHILRPAELRRCPETRMTATLHTPGPAAPRLLPAVVQLHGSFGWREHHNLHAARLVEAGFVVLQVDSFAARGVESTAARQIACTMAMQCHDALMGLSFLASLSGLVDAARVGVAGWSLGGGASAYCALEAVAAAVLGRDGPRFAAHLAVYPAFMYRPIGMAWTSAPILTLIGALDNYSKTAVVREVSDYLRLQGANAAMLVYPDSHHSFDNVAEPMRGDPKWKAMGGVATVDLHPDGHMHVTGLPEAAYNTEADRIAHGRKISSLGAHVGGNAEQAPKAFADARAFFDRCLQGGGRRANL